MLLLLTFLLFFSVAITALLLLVDTLYARSRADERLDHAHGRHWAPRTVLMEEHAATGTLLPPHVRPRLWIALVVVFALGSVLLVATS